MGAVWPATGQVHDPWICMIWAQAANGVIGRDGTMPWHLPEDLKHFRDITGGQPVIMGRRTWDSLPQGSRPLPGRVNIVITRQAGWTADGALRAGSLAEALVLAKAAANRGSRLWIVGGGSIYTEALGTADTAVITRIDAEVAGDTRAPALGPGWHLAFCAPSAGWAVAANGTRYRIETWQNS